jgi:hypothetical protein
MALSAVLFGLLASFKFGRSLLEKVLTLSLFIQIMKCDIKKLVFFSQYPKFFSFGVFGHDGPTKEEMDATSFVLTLAGKGWSEKLTEPTDAHTSDPDKELVVRVSGPEPGYVATPICMVQAALVLLRDADELPAKYLKFSLQYLNNILIMFSFTF